LHEVVGCRWILIGCVWSLPCWGAIVEFFVRLDAVADSERVL
jgi:hypothetical protein